MSVPIGLYVHWPFCARVCPYCDFCVTRARQVDFAAWQDALCTDLAMFAPLAGARPLQSIYFGGGTPSLLPPGFVAAIIDAAASAPGLRADAEITIEANPTDAEMSRFADYRLAGVNRVSLGIQSFDDAQLRFLGRNHDGATARTALAMAARIMPRVSIDLIYALPDEGEAAWARRLSASLSPEIGHASLYQLTIEPGTAFSRRVARGQLARLPDEAEVALYRVTQDVTATHGLSAYEVSNHARAGNAAGHNHLYWDDADWIAIGPGAHGRLWRDGARLATQGTPRIGAFLGMTPAARYTEENLGPVDIATEQIAGGLRPVAGMPMARLDPDIASRLAPVRARLIAEGLLDPAPDRLRVMPEHRLLIDRIALELCAAL